MHLGLGEAGEGWEQTLTHQGLLQFPPATSVLFPIECPLSSCESPVPGLDLRVVLVSPACWALVFCFVCSWVLFVVSCFVSCGAGD